MPDPMSKADTIPVLAQLSLLLSIQPYVSYCSSESPLTFQILPSLLLFQDGSRRFKLSSRILLRKKFRNELIHATIWSIDITAYTDCIEHEISVPLSNDLSVSVF